MSGQFFKKKDEKARNSGCIILGKKKQKEMSNNDIKFRIIISASKLATLLEKINSILFGR